MFYIAPIITIAALVGIDRYTKALCLTRMALYETAPLIPGVVRLYSTRNTGAAFGALEGGRWVFLAVMAVAVVAMIYFYMTWPRERAYLLPRVCLTLIIAGAIGNGIDRALTGEVVDFFEFEFVSFAIFNVADIFITCGAALLVLATLFGGFGRKHG